MPPCLALDPNRNLLSKLQLLLAPDPFPRLSAEDCSHQIPLVPNLLCQIPLVPNLLRQIQLPPNPPLCPGVASLAVNLIPIPLRQILDATIGSSQELDPVSAGGQVLIIRSPQQSDLLSLPPFCQSVVVTTSAIEAPHLTSPQPPSPKIKKQRK